MARRTTSNLPAPASLSVEQMNSGIKRIEKCIANLREFDVTQIKNDSCPEVRALEASIGQTLTRVFGNTTSDYRQYIDAATLSHAPPVVFMDEPSVSEIRQWFEEGRKQSLALLRQAVEFLHEEIEYNSEAEKKAVPAATTEAAYSDRVFIVHGHDNGAKEAVARFLEKLKLKPIILHEQANQGQTIIEKFEACSDVGFAIILLTPDDKGGTSDAEEMQARARQNVILELGYFIGSLGRKRVCALKAGPLEIPSDILGVVWGVYDESGGWKQTLAIELQAAGYEIDWNMVMR